MRPASPPLSSCRVFGDASTTFPTRAAKRQSRADRSSWFMAVMVKS